MKWSMLLCVAFSVSGFAFGDEPTLADPQNTVVADANANCESGHCSTCHRGFHLLPWRNRTVSVASGDCCGTEVVARTVSRPRWFGCGRVERTRCHTRRARCCR